MTEGKCRETEPMRPSFLTVALKCDAARSVNTRKSSAVTLRFNDRFPGGPGLADTGVSLLWILLELRMTEVLVTTEAVRTAKFQSNRHHQPWVILRKI